MVVLPSLRARHLCSGQQASGGSGSVTWRGASLVTPSWNRVVGCLTEWEGLRRMAA